MRESSVKIKVPYKDQGSSPINAMVIKENLTKAWEKQGLIMNVDCWL
jgi:hypothetical protein